MKTQQWWKDYEKDWLMERWNRDLERNDMKKLRRLYWSMKDDGTLFVWAFVIWVLGALLWIGLDKALGLFR